eukprot:g11562.t1
MSTACCEQVRKAVAEFEQGREPREALQSTEQVKTGPEAEAVVPLQATGEALAASPPKAPAPERVSPNKDTSQEKSRPSSRPELVLDIASPEAARALLDMVYGLGREYNITSDEANKDVLRLAKQLDIPSLQACLCAVARLQTCQEFGLDEMYDAIVEEVVMTRDALQLVAANEEVMKYPAILQGLLVRSANMHRPVRKRTKRELEESKAGKPEKIPKDVRPRSAQEETWRQTCEKERFIEVLAHPAQTTFHDVAQKSGPTRSTSHTTHCTQNLQAASNERPAGKPSPIGRLDLDVAKLGVSAVLGPRTKCNWSIVPDCV